jgi:hypothetical protein
MNGLTWFRIGTKLTVIRSAAPTSGKTEGRKPAAGSCRRRLRDHPDMPTGWERPAGVQSPGASYFGAITVYVPKSTMSSSIDLRDIRLGKHLPTKIIKIGISQTIAHLFHLAPIFFGETLEWGELIKQLIQFINCFRHGFFSDALQNAPGTYLQQSFGQGRRGEQRPIARGLDLGTKSTPLPIR